jgi:hypothetical protein
LKSGGARAFGAALDAAEGTLWLRDPIRGDGPGPRYATQARWVERCARLLGLSEQVGARIAEQIAEELGVPGMEQRRLRTSYAQAATLQQRGNLIAELLAELRLDEALWGRLLAAGFLAGLWGVPRLFFPSLQRAVSPISRVGRALRGPP